MEVDGGADLNGVFRREVELVVGGGTDQLFVEFGSNSTRTDLVGVVVGNKTRQRFAVDGAGNVDGDQVAVLGWPFDLDELGRSATNGVDLVVDGFARHHRVRDRDLEGVVATQLDHRTNLNSCVEHDRAGLFA